jgi:hypothetical protein
MPTGSKSHGPGGGSSRGNPRFDLAERAAFTLVSLLAGGAPLKMGQRFGVREVLHCCLLTGTTTARMHLRELIARRAVNILR